MLRSQLTCLVTGSSSGIGAALCDALVLSGARVAMVDVALPRGQAAKARPAQHPNALPLPCDVTDESALRAAFGAAETHFGTRLNVVCNNAGTAAEGAAWQETLALNLGAVVCGSLLALEHMAGEGGTLLNTASMAGLVPMPGGAVYCASKHGVVGLTRSLALQQSAVRALCVCPSYTETPLLADVPSSAVAAQGGALPVDLVVQGMLRLIDDHDIESGAVMRVTNRNGIDFQAFR